MRFYVQPSNWTYVNADSTIFDSFDDALKHIAWRSLENSDYQETLGIVNTRPLVQVENRNFLQLLYMYVEETCIHVIQHTTNVEHMFNDPYSAYNRCIKHMNQELVSIDVYCNGRQTVFVELHYGYRNSRTPVSYRILAADSIFKQTVVNWQEEGF